MSFFTLPPTGTPTWHYVFYSPVFCINSKFSVQRGSPRCKCTLLWSIQLLPCSPLSLASHLHYSTAFNPSTCTVMYFNIVMLCYSLFLSLLPEFHRAVPLVQTCSTSEVVYDHVCFCVYVYLLDLFSTYERKSCGLCFSEPGLLHLTWCPPIASIYLQTTGCHLSLWLNETLLYICIYVYIHMFPELGYCE
jgi:hypothetical protein